MENQVIVEVVRMKQVTRKVRGFDSVRITSPQIAITVARALAEKFIADEDREVFFVIGLNTQNLINYVQKVHIGSLNASIVHPRDVYKSAITYNCASIIISHNHPSAIREGSRLEPSKEDIEVTKRLDEVGKIIGIELIDHLIVAGTKYYSLKEKGYL